MNNMDKLKTFKLSPILQDRCKWAKEMKEGWIDQEVAKKGDIYPFLFIERDGAMLATLMAPVMDVDYALHVADFARKVMSTDRITLIADAHVNLPGMDVEKFLKDYKRGDMQKACDEQNACELGIMTDCLNVSVATKNGVEIACIPYTYHVTNKTNKFEWTGEPWTITGEGVVAGGRIADALKQIMNGETLQNPLDELGAMFGHFSPERRRFHCDRGALRALSSRGVFVMDNITSKHPEWIDEEKPN